MLKLIRIVLCVSFAASTLDVTLGGFIQMGRNVQPQKENTANQQSLTTSDEKNGQLDEEISDISTEHENDVELSDSTFGWGPLIQTTTEDQVEVDEILKIQQKLERFKNRTTMLGATFPNITSYSAERLTDRISIIRHHVNTTIEEYLSDIISEVNTDECLTFSSDVDSIVSAIKSKRRECVADQLSPGIIHIQNINSTVDQMLARLVPMRLQFESYSQNADDIDNASKAESIVSDAKAIYDASSPILIKLTDNLIHWTIDFDFTFAICEVNIFDIHTLSNVSMTVLNKTKKCLEGRGRRPSPTVIRPQNIKL